MTRVNLSLPDEMWERVKEFRRRVPVNLSAEFRATLERLMAGEEIKEDRPRLITLLREAFEWVPYEAGPWYSIRAILDREDRKR